MRTVFGIGTAVLALAAWSVALAGPTIMVKRAGELRAGATACFARPPSNCFKVPVKVVGIIEDRASAGGVMMMIDGEPFMVRAEDVTVLLARCRLPLATWSATTECP